MTERDDVYTNHQLFELLKSSRGVFTTLCRAGDCGDALLIEHVRPFDHTANVLERKVEIGELLGVFGVRHIADLC